MINHIATTFFIWRNWRFSGKMEEHYSEGGSFETTMGNTQYEVAINFRQEGMRMQEKALRAVKECISCTSEDE